MSGRDRRAAAGWWKIGLALLCTVLAGLFIYYRVRGPAPARVDPKFRENGRREWSPRGPRAEPAVPAESSATY